jgi:hypothetical protein
MGNPFVSIKGSPYTRFRRALDTGNLTLVGAAAAELRTINLDDALRICLLLRADPPATRGRLSGGSGDSASSGRTRPSELKLAVAAFERLPSEPDKAAVELRRFVWH